MAKGLNVLGKFLSGAAEVGVPLAFEKSKNDAIAKRDKQLQQYQTGQREAAQDFTAQQNLATRTAASEEKALDRAASTKPDYKIQVIDKEDDFGLYQEIYRVGASGPAQLLVGREGPVVDMGELDLTTMDGALQAFRGGQMSRDDFIKLADANGWEPPAAAAPAGGDAAAAAPTTEGKPLDLAALERMEKGGGLLQKHMQIKRAKEETKDFARPKSVMDLITEDLKALPGKAKKAVTGVVKMTADKAMDLVAKAIGAMAGSQDPYRTRGDQLPTKAELKEALDVLKDESTELTGDLKTQAKELLDAGTQLLSDL